MMFEEACAFACGTNNFGWLLVRYDFDSKAWTAMSDQTGTTAPLEADNRLAAQDEALARYNKRPASGWVYSGNDEDGSKVVVI